MTATRLHPRSLIAAFAVGALALAACGSDDAGEQLPLPTAAADQPADAPADEPDGGEPDADVPAGDSEQVIGTNNMGGTIVDPKPYPINDIAVAESFPEQLMVQFTAGDANCLAATATATATGSNVIVTLDVGITEDALTKSCLAGDVEHTLTIPLDEGLDGREVVAAEV